MGPTTAALLQFFQADQAFLEAKQKLEAATRNVRLQETKAAQLKTEHDAAHHSALGAEAKAREAELELKAREERIEFLRQRQTNATNQKEYQALIVEINTQKTDKGKLEEQVLTQMEQVAGLKKNEGDLKGRFDGESTKHKQMAAEIDDRVKELTKQVEALRGPRDTLSKVLPPAAIHAYKRADDRYPGEALAEIEKPNVRDQEYLCSGCNTYLVADVYNRLRNATKDEVVTCPSCHRILYIPDEMTSEIGLSMKAARGSKPKAAPGEKKKRAPSKKKEKAAAAEPGSVAAAVAAGASAASGKGPKDKRKAQEAPLPSTADGVSNTADAEAAETADAASETSDSAST